MRSATKSGSRNFLKPVRNERDRARALGRARELMKKDHMSAEERDELELLAIAVQHYERNNYERYGVEPHEVLEGLITDGRHTQRAVAKATGIAVSTISEIVRGRRKINARQAVALGDYFKIRADAFLPRS